MPQISKKEELKEHLRKTTLYPDNSFWAELESLPYEDILDIALMLVDRFSDDCDTWCADIREANIPIDQASLAQTAELMAKLTASRGKA